MRDNSYITPAFKKRMAEKLKGNQNALGHTPAVFSEETKKEISRKLTGIKRSRATRLKMSRARTGTKPTAEALQILRDAGKLRWKPWNELTYMGLHSRLRRLFGNPKKCDKCGTTKHSFYDWSNISGKYLERRSDWERLCRGCHGKHEVMMRGGKRRAVSLKKEVNRRSKDAWNDEVVSHG